MVITDLNNHTTSYVTVAELAEYWDVTRQLVYKHIQSGQLPAIQLGPRCFRVHTRDAVAFERLVSSKWRKTDNGNGVAKLARPSIVAVANRLGQGEGERKLSASRNDDTRSLRSSETPQSPSHSGDAVAKHLVVQHELGADLARVREELALTQPTQPAEGAATAEFVNRTAAASFLQVGMGTSVAGTRRRRRAARREGAVQPGEATLSDTSTHR